jgi:hypothetical protein
VRRHEEPAVRFDDVAVDLALRIRLNVFPADGRDVVDELDDLPVFVSYLKNAAPWCAECVELAK